MLRPEYKLNEIFDFKELANLFKHFTVTVGLDVALYDAQGSLVLPFYRDQKASVCSLANNCPTCQEYIKYGGEKAWELGEPYIFRCGCGLIMCSSPVAIGDILIGSIACGPVMLWEADDYAGQELDKNLKAMGIECEVDPGSIQQLSCVNMTSAAQILYIFVNYICREYEKSARQKMEIARQKDTIAELAKKGNYSCAYPADLEKKLILYVQLGEKNKAREIINSFLGEIFSYAGGNLDIIKAKLYEFTAFLSRAAVEAGAPLSEMAATIRKSARFLSKNIEFLDVCSLTIEILYDFIDIVYRNRPKKQYNRHLISAIEYIDQNFRKRLTLKSVAKSIYVSPYYLSHIFRDELDTTFSDYVNSKRIEEAKRLLGERSYDTKTLNELVGFNDVNYFIKIFKKYTGTTPSKYRGTR
jgi:two-component system response regulator YesN